MPQQTGSQKRLHVAPTIGNDIDHDALVVNSVDKSVWLKKYLTIFAHPQRPQFFRHRTTPRFFQESVADFEQAIEHMLWVMISGLRCACRSSSTSAALALR